MPAHLPADPMLFYYASIARRAARDAGEVIKSMLFSAAVHEKSSKDLVTDADIAAQQIIQDVLLKAFPDHGFVGEEEGAASDFSKFGDRLCWVVDPIDGTANYVHRLNNFAVSIALVKSGKPLVGVVYDPMSNELFCAIEGEPATLNDSIITASKCEDISKALIAASFPPNIKRGDDEIEQFVNVLVSAQSVRRLGSAALNLCFVGCGRLDAYWAAVVRPWDVAAGVLIAQQAGATLTARNGEAFDLAGSSVAVAATKKLHVELMKNLT